MNQVNPLTLDLWGVYHISVRLTCCWWRWRSWEAKKWHIFGNSAVLLFLSSSLNAWLSPQAARARTVSIHNYANITIILADAWNVRICLRINRCTLNPEIWNTFEQRTLLASIFFVRLNFESSLKLIYGRISKKSNLENSKKSCYLCFEPKRNQTSNLRMWLFQSFKFHNINIPQPSDYKLRDHTTS